MRKLILILVFLALATAFVGSTAGSNSATSADDEQTIRALNLEWLRVYDFRDVAALDRIEDNDLTLAGDFGQIDKRAHLDSVRKEAATAGQVNRLIEKQQIRFYCDIAVVTEVDRYPDDKRSFQSTGIWVKRADSWKPVHLHYTVLATTD